MHCSNILIFLVSVTGGHELLFYISFVVLAAGDRKEKNFVNKLFRL